MQEQQAVAEMRQLIDAMLTEHPTYPTAEQRNALNGQKDFVDILADVRLKAGLRSALNMLRDHKEHNPQFSEWFNAAEEPKEERQSSTKHALDENGVPRLPDAIRYLPVDIQNVSPTLYAYMGYSKTRSPEGPHLYHMAGGIWLLSVVAARRIYVAIKTKLYTSLYISLVSRSSVFAKSVTADAAIYALQQCKLDWLLGSDEVTPQKLLANMSGAIPKNYGDWTPAQQDWEKLRLAMAGQVGWYYDEFNQFINGMTRPNSPMADFAGLMRTLDNGKAKYTGDTFTHGRLTVDHPYLAFMGSTTPANLRKHAGRGAEFWNDGFWARFLFACPREEECIIDTMGLGLAEVPNELVLKLQAWNKRLGVPTCDVIEGTTASGKGSGQWTLIPLVPMQEHEVTVEQDAYQAFVAYRVALKRLVIEKKTSHDFDGSYARLPTIALRIAALLASVDNDNILSLDIWKLAQHITELFRYSLHEMYAQVSLPEQESVTEESLLLGFLRDEQSKQKDRAWAVYEIQQRGPSLVRKHNAEGIRKLLLELEKSGRIERETGVGRKERYKYVVGAESQQS